MEQTYKKIDMDTAVSMLKDHQLWLSSGGKEGKQAVFTGYDLSGFSKMQTFKMRTVKKRIFGAHNCKGQICMGLIFIVQTLEVQL